MQGKHSRFCPIRELWRAEQASCGALIQDGPICLTSKGCAPTDGALICIHWYVAYPLSYRHFEEMTAERGVPIDHTPAKQWAIRLSPLTETTARKHKRPVGGRWRIDGTYFRVKGS